MNINKTFYIKSKKKNKIIIPITIFILLVNISIVTTSPAINLKQIINENKSNSNLIIK